MLIKTPNNLFIINKKLTSTLIFIIFFYVCLIDFMYYNTTHKKTLDDSDLNEKTTDFYRSNVDEENIIFIGGYRRSGTTLIRAILDVHPSVSCGPETRIIPKLLTFLKDTYKDTWFSFKFKHSGLSESTMDTATSLFIRHLLQNHVETSERLCAKDPDILHHMEFLHRLFPKAKFVYMVRDGRASTFSLLEKRKENKTFENFIRYFRDWNQVNEIFYAQCKSIGERFCKMVKYEDLVQEPKRTISELVKFLDITWTNDFLRHNEFVGDKIVVSKVEWSTEQIKKPIYKESLVNWVGKVENYDRGVVEKESGFIKMLGYNVFL